MGRPNLLAFVAATAFAQTYVRDVYPIWEKHCLGCHASGTTMGSLDIETWEGIQRGGNHGTIIVPGDARASRLYTMLTGESKPAMPMDGQVLSAAEIEVVRQWIAAGAAPPNAAEIALLRRKAAGETASPITAMAWRPNTNEVAVARTTGIQLLDATTLQVRATLPADARTLVFSRDGRRLAVVADAVTLWDAASLQRLAAIHATGAVAFSRDGRLVATAGPRRIEIWTAATGLPLRGWEGTATLLAFSTDGTQLIAGSAAGTTIWQIATGRRLEVNPHLALSMSPNGERVAAMEAGALHVHELSQPSHPSKGYATELIALAWSGDGHRIVILTANGTLQVLNATTLGVLATFTGAHAAPFAVSNAGESILVTGAEGSLQLLVSKP